MLDAKNLLASSSRQEKLVEVRVDGIQDLDLQQLLCYPRPKVIITNRRHDEGGTFRGSDNEQFLLLANALDFGAEYVDMELSCGRQLFTKLLARHSRKRVICSYHNFERTPSNLAKVYHQCQATKAGTIKLATMANSIIDNSRMFDILKQAHRDRQPMIGICMGEYGQISRILGGKFNTLLTFAPIDENLSTAPGQLTLSSLNSIFHVQDINRNTKIFGLIGNPVKHSQGIYYHNNRFQRHSRNAVYVNFLVDNIKDFFSCFRGIVSGLSVTMPFKSNVIPFLDRVDETSEQIKAVNTIIHHNHRLTGYNTDLPAVTQLLRRHTTMKNKRTTVLGTGATARTMAYVLVAGGSHVTILGRSIQKARKLAEELSCSFGRISDLPTTEPDIIMNGTSVGMTASSFDGASSLVPKSFFHKRMIVFDAVYDPRLTPMLRDAHNAGCRIIAGTELFERQAYLQSTLFMKMLP